MHFAVSLIRKGAGGGERVSIAGQCHRTSKLLRARKIPFVQATRALCFVLLLPHLDGGVVLVQVHLATPFRGGTPYWRTKCDARTVVRDGNRLAGAIVCRFTEHVVRVTYEIPARPIVVVRGNTSRGGIARRTDDDAAAIM